MTARRQREAGGEIEYTQRGLPGKSLHFILSLPFFRASQEFICLAFLKLNIAEAVFALRSVRSACFAMN